MNRNKPLFNTEPKFVPVQCMIALACLGLSGLAAYPYLRNHIVAMLFSSAAFACGLFALSRRYAVRKMERNRLDQFLWLLEFMTGKLSSGHTLEKTLLEATEVLESGLGRHRELHAGLTVLKKNLQAQVDLSRALLQFSLGFSCPQASRILQLLARLRLTAGQPSEFIRSSHRMLHEQITMLTEAQAEQHSKYSEAAILAGMPFVLSALLVFGVSQYSASLQSTVWALPAQLGVYLLAAAAACLAILIMIPETGSVVADKKPRPGRWPAYGNRRCRNRQPFNPSNTDVIDRPRLVGYLKALYMKWLPWSVLIRFSQQLTDLYPNDTDPWIRHLKAKVQIGFAGMGAGLLLTLIRPSLWFLLLPAVLLPMLYHDRKLLERRQRQLQRRRLEYPGWLNLVALLLASGLSLQRTLELAIHAYLPDDHRSNGTVGSAGRNHRTGTISIGESNGGLIKDLLGLQQQIERGQRAAEALTGLSQRIAVAQIQSVLQLMIRYDRDGGTALLQLIQIQAGACWQIQKNALRKKLETKSLLLLIPMGMDLLAVLATAIIPAIASLHIVL